MIICRMVLLVIFCFAYASGFDEAVRFDRDTVVVEKEGDAIVTVVLSPSHDTSHQEAQPTVSDTFPQEQAAASPTTLIKRSLLDAKQLVEKHAAKNVQTLVPQELCWWQKLCCCRHNRKR